MFVPDIRTGSTVTAATDVECGYRAALDAAEDFGGDPAGPVTVVGWSFGAVTALYSGLDEEATGLRSLAEGCSLDAPRPDVIVSIAGCYTTWDGDTEPIDPDELGWTNKDAKVILIAGQLDPVCDPSESAAAASSFGAARYEVEFIEVESGDHGSMLFFPPEAHGSIEDPQGAAGEQTIQVITEAIETAAS